MNIHEYQAKAVLKEFGLPISRGVAIFDPSEAEAVEGAVMASVPLFLDAGRAVRVNLSLDAAALAMIDDAAGKRGLTRSAFLVSAARDKVLAEG